MARSPRCSTWRTGIEVVAQVGRGDEVLAAVAEHRPDVAVLDIEMPGMDGLSAAEQISSRVQDR